jgi:transcriptional regulator GlxA family with amidase domain
LTTDQSNIEVHMPPAYSLGIVTSVESSDDGAERAPIWDARRHHAPALYLRLPHRGDRQLGGRLSSTSMPRPTTSGTNHCPSRTEHLLMSAYSDISRLNEILRPQQSAVVIRDMDGLVLALDSAAKPIEGCRNNAGTVNLALPLGTSAISTPIFDAEGCALASLEIIQGEARRADSSEQLLRALVESAARAITERWFRLVHRRQWVVAAMRRNSPGTMILFATDRDQRIVGADRHTRQLLAERGQRMGQHLTVSALFRPNPTLLRRRSYWDVSTTLFASGDGEPWIALVTPPDAGALASHQDARVLLHVRPRLDSLSQLSSLPSAARARRGLSQAALQRIEEHITANLDKALDIDELAAIVRMSSSHFTRSFHKSVGVTPHRYVIQNRVMRARELLATTNLPLTEIALTTGFSDQSHFSRRFHEIVGIPPGAFRANDGRMPA